MKQTYEYGLGGLASHALLSPTMGGYYIAFLATPAEVRNKGWARRVLTMVCADADTEQVDLWLDPAPLGKSVDRTRLENFYRRFGFVPIQGEGFRRFRKANTNETEKENVEEACC